MYLLALSLVYCLAYLILFFGIPFFFTSSFPTIHRRSIASVAFFLTFYFAILMLSSLIPNRELANRALHAFGGGSLMIIICFFATKDSKTEINRFQFFIMSLSIATLFGVANEILEFFLQNHFGFLFADSINDTWLDLISNTIGALLILPIPLYIMRKK